jgi:glycosyltransferase involved in cell wall biosynthesis
MAARKILTIGHAYAVAMNRRLAHEMARLDPERWEITVVAPRYFHGSNDLRPISLTIAPDEPVRVVPVHARLTRRVHVFTYGRALRAVLARGWDVVHCWEEPYVLVGAQIARWTPPRTALIVQTAQNIRKSYPVPFRWFESYVTRRATGFICCGELVADNLRSRPCYDGSPIATIPLGTDVSRFRPDASRRRAVREKLGWAVDGAPVVAYFGRFVPEKGLELLPRVLDRVTTPWRALFVGAGSMEPALRAWAREKGDRVRICNDVGHDEVPAYLNASDLVCAPSQTTPAWREQFGRMVVEAFASGVAVVGSDSGEIPFVVRDSGRVVGERDEAGWVRAVGELLDDRRQRDELVARGLERAVAEFSWRAVATRFLAFFEESSAAEARAVAQSPASQPAAR